MTAPTEAEVRAWLLSELAESQRFIGMDMLAGKERGNPDARREAHKLSNMLRAALALLDEARKDKERLEWVLSWLLDKHWTVGHLLGGDVAEMTTAIDQARGA